MNDQVFDLVLVFTVSFVLSFIGSSLIVSSVISLRSQRRHRREGASAKEEPKDV